MEEDIYVFQTKQFINTLTNKPLEVQLFLLEEIHAIVNIYDLAGILKNPLKLNEKFNVFIVYDLQKCIDEINKNVESGDVNIFLANEHLNGRAFEDNFDFDRYSVLFHYF